MVIPPNLTEPQLKALGDHAKALAKKKNHCCNSGACMECWTYRLGRKAVQAGVPEDLIDQICKADAVAREIQKAQEAARNEMKTISEPVPPSDPVEAP